MNEVLLYVLLWLLSGWLPTRILKHYFHARFDKTLGPEQAWGHQDELLILLTSLCGPLCGIAAFMARGMFDKFDKCECDNVIPWGFRL